MRQPASFNRLLRVILGVTFALLAGCAELPSHSPARAPSSAIPRSDQEELGRIAAASVPQGQSGFRPLPMSNYSMDARLTLIQHAQRSIDLQYYLLQNDVTGHTFLRAVRDAALRGVRVRILVDDLYTADSDEMFVALSAYPHIEVRLFNPFPAGRAYSLTRWAFSLTDLARVNHRMHNKMMIVDGAFAIAGGRNVADEYFFNSKSGNFVDFDLLVAGDAVTRMQAIFDQYWNSPRVYRLESLEPRHGTLAENQKEFDRLSADAVGAFPAPPDDEMDLLGYHPLSGDIKTPPLNLLRAPVEVFADDPEKVSGRAETGTDPTTVTSHVLRMIGEAQSEVLLGSPYFVPGKGGMEGLRLARERGVAITVMTNSLGSNDEPLASAAYARYRKPMLELGIQLYETASGELHRDPLIGRALRASVGRSHTKIIVVDHEKTFVGSMNLDLRSSRLNTEFGMVVDSPTLARMVLGLGTRVVGGSYHLRLTPDGRIQWVGMGDKGPVVYDHDPDLDTATELQMLLLSPFVSESLL